MLQTSVIEGTNVVSVTADGSISTEEEVVARQIIDEVVGEHGSARMLLEFAGVDVGRVEPKAVWEDLKSTRLLGDIDRVAVVADSGMLDKLVGAADALSSMEMRTFESGRRDEAVAWLTS
jgi:hypothetical protein